MRCSLCSARSAPMLSLSVRLPKTILCRKVHPEPTLNPQTYLQIPIQIDGKIDMYNKKRPSKIQYSTVTHLEQPVYLAIWKDLNRKKRKENRKKIEP